MKLAYESQLTEILFKLLLFLLKKKKKKSDSLQRLRAVSANRQSEKNSFLCFSYTKI